MVEGRFLFVADEAPYGNMHCRELLDMACSAAAFDQPASLLLEGDAVLWALADAEPAGIEQKNLSRQLGVLPVYGLDALYACAEALNERGLDNTRLVDNIRPVEKDDKLRLYRSHEQVILL